MNDNASFFLKIWSTKNDSDFALYIIKFIWFNKFDQINLTMYCGDSWLFDWFN